MIFVYASLLCLGPRLAKCLKFESTSKYFQPGEGTSRGHVCNCEFFVKVGMKL